LDPSMSVNCSLGKYLLFKFPCLSFLCLIICLFKFPCLSFLV
jgi:hypothetical protein